MYFFRAEAKRIADLGDVLLTIDDKFDLTLKNVTEFLALVLEITSATAAGSYVVHMTFQKITASMGSEWLDLVTSAVASGSEPRARRCPHHDVAGTAFLSEELSNRKPQRRGQPL
jgi:hypothetical protein